MTKKGKGKGKKSPAVSPNFKRRPPVLIMERLGAVERGSKAKIRNQVRLHQRGMAENLIKRWRRQPSNPALQEQLNELIVGRLAELLALVKEARDAIAEPEYTEEEWEDFGQTNPVPTAMNWIYLILNSGCKYETQFDLQGIEEGVGILSLFEEDVDGVIEAAELGGAILLYALNYPREALNRLDENIKIVMEYIERKPNPCECEHA